MKKFDWRLIGQLELGLDLEEVDQDPGAPSFGEVRARSEAARKLLEGLVVSSGVDAERWGDEPPEWFGHFIKLLELGFSWRIACYIAWAASPRQGRWPRTQAELATEVLGLSGPRQISEWRKKYPKIDDAIALIQAAPLWEHRADIYEALVAVATSHDYKGHSDRKLALELLGDYVPRSKIDATVGGARNLSELSDDELDALAARIGLKGAEGSEEAEGPEEPEGSEVADVSE